MILKELQAFKRGMSNYGQTIAAILNFIMLCVVYFLGVGLTSIVARILKKKFLDANISKETKSYWSDLNLEKQPIERYYRQF